MRSPPARGCSWMTVDSSMSSGYCSLEDDLEDCFFTAKTTFFRNVQSKQPPKTQPAPPERVRGAVPRLQDVLAAQSAGMAFTTLAHVELMWAARKATEARRRLAS